MSMASRTLDDRRREMIFQRASANDAAGSDANPPWQKIRAGEMPPMMFQLRFRSGEMFAFAYSDLREIHVRDAGRIQFGVLGMSRLVVTVEGRNLWELAECLGSGLIRWMREVDEREVDRPETSGCITELRIEVLERGGTTE